MGELHSYEFPARPTAGVLFGLSAARLVAVAAAGVVFIAAMAHPTPTSVVGGLGVITLLGAGVAIKVAGRPAVDWLGVAVGYGWRMATRNNEFYASPDLNVGLPEGVLDLPGELFGIEVHSYAVTSTASVANPTPTPYGVVRDTFRDRLVAVAEVSGGDFLFLDPAEQQARVSAWGALLDHVAQSLPEVTRLQLVHTVGPAATHPLADHHRRCGGRGNPATAASYRDVLAAAGHAAHNHRTLVAVGLDLRQARKAIRHAGGGEQAAAAVLMDRAATIEELLRAGGVDVYGWLPARAIAQLVRVGFDPAASGVDGGGDDVNDGGGVDPAGAGPWGMVDSWNAVRHDSGWSTTLQMLRPPSRAVTGDFLQHLVVGVPARRRLSLLYLPTPPDVAERRAQTQQVSTESEQTLRARWGFGLSARSRRAWQDAARREHDVVAGRSVWRVVWLVTVTAPSPAALEASVGQVEAAARRCGLELRRLAGTQAHGLAATLPLCRGAR